MQTIDGRLVVIGGKMRSGKTAYVAQAIKKEPRVIAWDPHDQWGRLRGWKRITSMVELHRSIQTFHPARLAYVVGSDDIKMRFDQYCETALQWGSIYGRCAIIAEELADVSTPAKAPGAWGVLLRGSLKLNLDVYAISQRWAEADKTAINNASEIVCFSMMPMDVDYMARRTGIEAGELASLRKIETATMITLPYVRLVIDTGQLERNKLTFRK
jgi:hypothetical protein